MRVQGSKVRAQISTYQGEASPSTVDYGLFRRLVVSNRGAVHRPAAPPRRTPFPGAESLVAPATSFCVRNRW